MGQFSWLDCKNGSQVLDNEFADVYMLIPRQFGGGHHYEDCYDGYGTIGTYNVFELVATWNRELLTASMIRRPLRSEWGDNAEGDEYYDAALRRYDTACRRLEDYAAGKSDDELTDLYGDDFLRDIGTDIAASDEQNASLPYPIKITHDPKAIYEECKPSPFDPSQGWRG